MKKGLLYIAMIAVMLAGCRQKGDVYYDPNDQLNMSYATYAGQFEAIWHGLNTHYVFWSEDSTEWDLVYKEMLPRFQELDSAYKNYGTIPDSLTFVGMYQDVTSTLIDHHLAMQIRDVHTNKPYIFKPGQDEVNQRDYVQGQTYSAAAMKEAIDGFVKDGLLTSGTWGKRGNYVNFFGIRKVDTKKIAYYWQNNFFMTSTLQAGILDTDDELAQQYTKNIESWLDMCLNDEDLLGIILDNRCNGGGQVADLKIVIGPFISEPLQYGNIRYKEGPNRYEYTNWIPVYADTMDIRNRRDLEDQNIPYVVIANAYSISMAEMSSAAIKLLPTGCMIGERTFGAHGQLNSLSTIFHDGTFGDPNGKHYVYTSSMQTQFLEGGILEGQGVSPDKSILQMESGYAGAMEKAIDYIKAY
jgi:hypothetical protein